LVSESTEASSSSWASKRERLYAFLFAPVDVASLAIFRICFGAIMFWEVWRYFDGDRVTRYYVEPQLLFKYHGFSWVQPWPGDGMYWHFVVLGVLSLFVMVGLFYRLSSILLFPTFTYVFLLDQARYLNHFYLVSLICLLMIFLPAHRALSIDALIWRKRRSDVVPAWTLWLMRAQLGIVYLYASFAKMNGDWLNNQPVRMWLAGQEDRTLIFDAIPVGKLFVQEWFVQFYTWGGLLFDLLIVPALLWRRTRALAFVACLGFHLMNAWVYRIGIFPWFMICATTLFFEPSWPRKVKLLFAPFREGDRPDVRPTAGSPLQQRIIVTLIGVYLAAQLLIPFRHLLYPGTVHWTEEGHRWSWHMKLRSKDCRGAFFVEDPVSGATAVVKPERFLAEHQTGKVLARPDMILQFAHFLRDKWQASGFEQVEVRAKIRCSLNGRPYQVYVDPDVDLAAEQRTLGHVPWIVPLRTPLDPDATR
jgi:vitamin K-dependent gamma-carboxylase